MILNLGNLQIKTLGAWKIEKVKKINQMKINHRFNNPGTNQLTKILFKLFCNRILTRKIMIEKLVIKKEIYYDIDKWKLFLIF